MREQYELVYRLMRMEYNNRIDKATAWVLYRAFPMQVFIAACKSEVARLQTASK